MSASGLSGSPYHRQSMQLIFPTHVGGQLDVRLDGGGVHDHVAPSTNGPQAIMPGWTQLESASFDGVLRL